MNATRMTSTFITAHSRSESEREWLSGVFKIMVRVARRNRQFSMDSIWEHLDRAYLRGSIVNDGKVDHRILGPMLRHMARDGLISSSGYYVKSSRQGGGSRPITVWTSHVYERVAVSA
jgi:hypothetical protein